MTFWSITLTYCKSGTYNHAQCQVRWTEKKSSSDKRDCFNQEEVTWLRAACSAHQISKSFISCTLDFSSKCCKCSISVLSDRNRANDSLYLKARKYERIIYFHWKDYRKLNRKKFANLCFSASICDLVSFSRSSGSGFSGSTNPTDNMTCGVQMAY